MGIGMLAAMAALVSVSPLRTDLIPVVGRSSVVTPTEVYEVWGLERVPICDASPYVETPIRGLLKKVELGCGGHVSYRSPVSRWSSWKQNGLGNLSSFGSLDFGFGKVRFWILQSRYVSDKLKVISGCLAERRSVDTPTWGLSGDKIIYCNWSHKDIGAKLPLCGVLRNGIGRSGVTERGGAFGLRLIQSGPGAASRTGQSGGIIAVSDPCGTAAVLHGSIKDKIAAGRQNHGQHHESYSQLFSKGLFALGGVLALLTSCKLISEGVDRAKALLVFLAFPCMALGVLVCLYASGLAPLLFRWP